MKMRKEVSATGWLIAQVITQFGTLDRQQHKIALPGEMLAGGFEELMGMGEMDEAILPVDCGAGESPVPPKGLPFGARQDLVEKRHAADSGLGGRGEI